MKEQDGKTEQTCPRADIAVYIDGELAPPQELALEQHLVACETCRTELNEQKKLLRALDFLLEEKPADIEIPKNFARVVATRAESNVSGLRNREERRRAVFLCASLGLIALIGLGAEAKTVFAAFGAVFEQVIALAVFVGHLIYDVAFGVVVILRSLANQTFVGGALLVALVAVVFWVVSRAVLTRLRHSAPVSHLKK
ncbi:MAG TPA: zf-HC2 domain-containing protein [Pyrinomonadaceae bacterium]|nr:zf-HC2 domain-containing protein [Pyrinomonadaceae bacterium]